MSKQVLTDLDFNSSARALNLTDPTLPQQPATKNYVDTLLQGLAWKDDVKAASTANISIASPGTTIDGVTMALNDRFLAKDQTTASENGIYVWNGSAVPATRATDANSNNSLLSAIVGVDQGTANSGTTWRQTAVSITLGTTALAFSSFGVSAPSASTSTPGVAAIATQAETDAGAVTNKFVTPQTLASWANRIRKFTSAIGDGSATQIDVTHNLGTNDISVEVVRATSPFDSVFCDVERPSTNIVRLRFASAPAASAFRVVVVG